MERKERLKKILEILSTQKKNVSGSALAKATGVTRQIIVQDVALLKSKGYDIISTARGYVLKSTPPRRTFLVAVRHTNEMIRKELECVVKNGGEVIDVIVRHPIYGEIRKTLNIKNMNDVERFMADLHTSNASPLLSLSNGVHMHTIGTDSEENVMKIRGCLKKLGILI